MKYSQKNRQAADKYYTKPEVAKQCYKILKDELTKEGVKDFCIIEPCAGDGKLMDAVDVDVYGWDLFPERDDIKRNDFLQNPGVPYDFESEKVKVMYANPPFGRSGILAKVFIDEALKHSPVAGFIVPNSFVNNCKKYNVVAYEWLPIDGFTYAGNDYEVNCLFVVLSSKKGKGLTITSREEDAVEEIPQPLELYVEDFVKVELTKFIEKLKKEYGVN